MTVVACRVYKDKIEIASDSIIVRGSSQKKGLESKFSKLFKINDMICGSAGNCSDMALFSLFCETRKPSGNTEHSVMTFFKEFSDWKKKQTESFDISYNDYIFIYNGKAFQFHNFFIHEITDYLAIGAGDDFANAAMYLGHDVEKAVETSCELSIYCEKPIIKYVVEK